MSPSSSLPATILFTPGDSTLPEHLAGWLADAQSPLLRVSSGDDLMAIAMRSRPRLVIFDARQDADAAIAACVRLKHDTHTAVVPAFVLAGGAPEDLRRWFDAAADEVVDVSASGADCNRRLDAMRTRSDGDLGVHPSTRLPGAAAIEADILRRMGLTGLFGVCYADVDHFKEYNDRYRLL